MLSHRGGVHTSIGHAPLPPPPWTRFKSYLCNRVQHVDIEGNVSSPKNIDISVLQGSILGPILFLCYINDLPNATKLLTHSLQDSWRLFRSWTTSVPSFITGFIHIFQLQDSWRLFRSWTTSVPSFITVFSLLFRLFVLCV